MTSCALTGFVATTLRAGAEEVKDRVAEARSPFARVFLSIIVDVASDDGVGDEEVVQGRLPVQR